MNCFLFQMSSPPQNGTKKRARVEEEEERPGPSTTRNIAALAADKSKPQTTPTTTTTTTTTTATTASNNVSASRRPSAQVSSASAAFPPPSIFRNEAFPCFDDITLQVAAFLVPHLASPDAQFIEVNTRWGMGRERGTSSQPARIVEVCTYVRTHVLTLVYSLC